MCFLRDCFSCSTGDHPVGLLVHKCDFASARKIGTLYQRCLHSRAIIYLISLKLSFSSVAQLCPTLCNPMDCSMPGFPVHHQLPEPTQTHVHRVSDAIQPSHPLSSPSPPAFNLSQHQGLFKWVSSSHQVAKVLEFQLQHQSFQWIFRLISFSIDWLNQSILSVSKLPNVPWGQKSQSPLLTSPKLRTIV